MTFESLVDTINDAIRELAQGLTQEGDRVVVRRALTSPLTEGLAGEVVRTGGTVRFYGEVHPYTVRLDTGAYVYAAEVEPEALPDEAPAPRFEVGAYVGDGGALESLPVGTLIRLLRERSTGTPDPHDLRLKTGLNKWVSARTGTVAGFTREAVDIHGALVEYLPPTA
ncbi:hypothetical protein [Kineococcus esterisolvens]|uniref:hypothetical protein n=1 Tax=unclassified Kineococcus TaxID=2621656 RepID=UPI003D7C7CA1